MPPLLPSPPPLPYFMPASRPMSKDRPEISRIPSPKLAEPGDDKLQTFRRSPPPSPPLSCSQSQDAYPRRTPASPIAAEHTATDKRPLEVPAARPPPLRRGPSRSAPPTGDGRQPPSFEPAVMPRISPPSLPLDPESHLNFYRTQILDNCKLLFPLESTVHIITSPQSAYITNGSSPPRILLDSTGGLRELYQKSQEQVAVTIASLQRHQDQSGRSAEKPELGSRQWGRDASSVVSSYMALRKEEKRRKKDLEKTAARKIPEYMRYTAPHDVPIAPLLRKPWSSMDLCAAGRQRGWDSVPRDPAFASGSVHHCTPQPQITLEQKIEMDSGLQSKYEVLQKVQRWRESVPAVADHPPPPPPPLEPSIGLGSSPPRTVNITSPLRALDITGALKQKGFTLDDRDDDFEFIDHSDAVPLSDPDALR